MRTINFNGAQIPAIGMGTWHMGSDNSLYDQQKATLQYGLNHGATVIDTAEQYGSGDSEKIVGDAMKGFPREEIFLISKFMPFHADRNSMENSLNASLKRLGTDYLDLYLYHWPGTTPLDQVVDNMEAMKASGKIKHWGVSNFDLSDMKKLVNVKNGNNVFANEDLYNIGDRGIDYDLIPWQEKNHIPLIAYAPIDQGDSRNHDINAKPNLKKVADEHKVSTFQIMLAWSIRNDQTLAIPQTDSQAHMKDNIIAGQIKLSDDDLAALNKDFPEPTSHQSLDII